MFMKLIWNRNRVCSKCEIQVLNYTGVKHSFGEKIISMAHLECYERNNPNYYPRCPHGCWMHNVKRKSTSTSRGKGHFIQSGSTGVLSGMGHVFPSGSRSVEVPLPPLHPQSGSSSRPFQNPCKNLRSGSVRLNSCWRLAPVMFSSGPGNWQVSRVSGWMFESIVSI